MMLKRSSLRVLLVIVLAVVVLTWQDGVEARTGPRPHRKLSNILSKTSHHSWMTSNSFGTKVLNRYLNYFDDILKAKCITQKGTKFRFSKRWYDFFRRFWRLRKRRQFKFFPHTKFSTNEKFRNRTFDNFCYGSLLDLSNAEFIYSKIDAGNKKRGRKIKYSLWEGDILIPDTTMDAFLEIVKKNSSKSGTRADFDIQTGISGSLWTDNIVPYQFASGYSQTDQQNVKAAMQRVESQTCVKFVPRTTEINHIVINALTGCSSLIGMHSGAQTLSLDNYCASQPGIIEHELAHTLGMHHTHSRVDRDDYVAVNFSNISPKLLHNFNIYPNVHSDPLSIEYDYFSVMHYSESDHAIDDDIPVIDPHVEQASIGQRDGSSYLDYVTINQMYDCYDKTPHYWPMDEIDETNGYILGSDLIYPPPASTRSSEYLLGLDVGYKLSALRVRGADSFADIGSYPNKCVVDPEFCSNGLTVAFWYKFDTATLPTPTYLISTMNENLLIDADRGYEIVVNRAFNDKLLFRISIVQQTTCYIGSTLPFGDYINDNWGHFAFTWDATIGVQMYVDGVSQGFSVPCGILGSSFSVDEKNPSLIIGKPASLPDNQYNTDFYMDDLVIWEKSLSSNEINSIRNGGPYHDMPSNVGSLGRREIVIGTVAGYTEL
ncbi:Embryonic protein UVS.2 [Trichoplax sp. H2]|uniref:Metalloendopeptidase n=1 Tax=Trichoplax adhaerens TaxID=10228 RepID=B3RTE3_TRIAD|nr:hypothetical protein TRIADDRAFT_54934 [Trichoplax adhaerens]EDV26680.1 hypothetical protein TRIADDRAFT_54934 [Trichoplax adhaerens]RDD39486.1 Embryonic protein UVS.2 [Trichoplax sp. H2]|eukprot:XP_002110676.1 hypothetical protein TRIADDRAFT_54934 [Trichoplax adhaerens]